MFFTKKQLGVFVKSIHLDKNTRLFHHTNNYLIPQLEFPYFFHTICKLVNINDFTRIAKATSYGEILLKQYEYRLKGTDPAIKNSFYLREDQFDLFISDILYPLLKILTERKEYKWQQLPQKWGLWREFGEKEKMPVGSEVCMNFKTGKNWLKM